MLSPIRLRRLARLFNGPAGVFLFVFTDPDRTPNLEALARRLRPGMALVYRHFGDPHALRYARRLRRITRGRGALLLIGADARLARRVRADGVHYPERMSRSAQAAKRAGVVGLATVAAHSVAALLRARSLDAAVLSPVFPSRSASAGAALGLPRARRMLRRAPAPVVALGGVRLEQAKVLARAGFCAMAGVDLAAD